MSVRHTEPARADPRRPGREVDRLRGRRGALGDICADLEGGGVVLLPDLAFDAPPPERLGVTTELRAKNISFDPLRGVLRGAGQPALDEALLVRTMADYARWTAELLHRVAPRYGPHLQAGWTSYRPRPAEHAMSPRKDDRRLHIDAFPSQPARGRRILRVFRNIHPADVPRIWQVGEPFAAYAARFLPRVRGLRPGEAWLLRGLGLTKSRRTPYDQLMLGLHDAAKASDAYQGEAPRETIAFRPGATWIAFTDAIPHAALSGRYALEQTFFLPVSAMRDEAASPLRILEAATGRRLA